MLRLARTAAACADALLTEGNVPANADLAAEAHRAKAAALRVGGHFQEAHAALDRACDLAQRGTGSEPLAGNIREERASVFLRQRRYRSALRLLDKVVEVRRSSGSPHEIAQALTRRSIAENETGQHELAAGTLIEALGLACDSGDRRLRLIVIHNLAEVFLDGGRPQEAIAWIESADVLYKTINDPLLDLRRSWIHGRMAREVGLSQLAEVKLRTALAGYDGRGMWYESAFVGLELAGVLASAGRLQECGVVAGHVANAFSAAGIPAEALAARLLRRAAGSSIAALAASLFAKAASSLRRRR